MEDKCLDVFSWQILQFGFFTLAFSKLKPLKSLGWNLWKPSKKISTNSSGNFIRECSILTTASTQFLTFLENQWELIKIKKKIISNFATSPFQDMSCF